MAAHIKVPAPADDTAQAWFAAFVELVRILRAECPWDKKQTNESIAHLLIEEAYETTDSIYKGDYDEFRKELGDLLLHVVMHSVMAEQSGKFDIGEVIRSVHTKMVDRHPHVFSDTAATDEEDVVKNWEKLKQKEGKASALEGVPISLPGLLRAERIQHKASKVGFDWQDSSAVWEKVFEEIRELRDEFQNGGKENIRKEFGDLLFSLVNVARHEGIVAEEALQLANNKFISRFRYMESKAKAVNKQMEEMTLEEMDNFWDEAKNNGSVNS